MDVAPVRVLKTLVVCLDDRQLAVAVVPVSCMLSMKRFAKAAGAKKAVMAAKPDAQRSTGHLLGGISPLGQKRALKTLIDTSAADYASVFVSAGRRGLESELALDDLISLTDGLFAPICQ